MDSLRESLNKNSSSSELIYFKIAQLHSENGEYDSATIFYKKVLNIYKSQNNRPGMASMLNNLGVTYYKLGNTDSCLYYYNTALAYYKLAKDSLNTASLQLNLGIVFKKEGRYADAMDNLLNAAKILEHSQKPTILASCYNTMANIYSWQKDFDKSIYYHHKALKIRKEFNLLNEEASTLNNIGAIYSKLGNYDSALSYYLSSLEFKQQLSNQSRVASTLNNIGLILIHLRKYSEAKNYLSEALVIREKSIDKSGKAAILNNFGKLYQEIDQDREALHYLDNAYVIINDLGLLELLRENLELRLVSLQKLNMISEALAISNQLIVVKDSLLNKDKIQSLIEMQTKYETEKKEQSIALLQQEKDLQTVELQLNRLWLIILIISILLAITIVLLVHYRFKRERKDKHKIETLMQELHHRVKNNLQLLSSIFSLQSKVLKDKYALDAVRSGENRVNAMALVHQQLYRQSGERTVNIRDYITRLVDELATSYGYEVNSDYIHLNIQDCEVDVDKMIPIGLIVNELVSNSFKYAFSQTDNPKLSIVITKSKSEIILEVADNGPGFEINLESKKSMGLNIIETLGRQLNANVKWTTNGQVKFNMTLALKE